MLNSLSKVELASEDVHPALTPLSFSSLRIQYSTLSEDKLQGFKVWDKELQKSIRYGIIAELNRFDY